MVVGICNLMVAWYTHNHPPGVRSTLQAMQKEMAIHICLITLTMINYTDLVGLMRQD
jgi:hypothetical protein